MRSTKSHVCYTRKLKVPLLSWMSPFPKASTDASVTLQRCRRTPGSVRAIPDAGRIEHTSLSIKRLARRAARTSHCRVPIFNPPQLRCTGGPRTAREGGRWPDYDGQGYTVNKHGIGCVSLPG